MLENDISKMRLLIESDLREIAIKYHKPYYEQYIKFKLKNGPNCPFCKAAVKAIYIAEINRKGNDFSQRFINNNWIGYE